MVFHNIKCSLSKIFITYPTKSCSYNIKINALDKMADTELKQELRDRCQVSFLILIEVEQIYQLLFPMKSSGNHAVP